MTKSSTLSLLLLYCRPFLLSWPRSWFNDHDMWSTPGFYLAYLLSFILILSPLRSTAPMTLLELKVRSLLVLLYMNRSGDFKISTQLVRSEIWRTTTQHFFRVSLCDVLCEFQIHLLSRSVLIPSSVFTLKAHRSHSHPLRSTCKHSYTDSKSVLVSFLIAWVGCVPYFVLSL